MTSYQAEQQRKWREAGKCSRCGKEADHGKMCKRCARKARLYGRKRYRAAHGIPLDKRKDKRGRKVGDVENKRP